jgi:hypothetical protein
MASIVGENAWHNASNDLSSINASIASTTEALNNATALYLQAGAALTACKGLSRNACLAKTGGYAISTWSPQYDNNKALIDKYKAELKSLLDIQSQLSSTQSTTATTTQQTAKANEAIAQAETVQATATGKKWIIYVGIGAGVIALAIGGFYLLKKVKKQ